MIFEQQHKQQEQQSEHRFSFFILFVYEKCVFSSFSLLLCFDFSTF